MPPREARVLVGRPAMVSILLAGVLALVLLRCHGPDRGEKPPISASVPARTVSPSEVVETPGVALDAEHTVGPPVVIGNLAVFPIYARVMEDIGDFIPLDQALEKGVAMVREVGAEAAGSPPPSGADQPQQINAPHVQQRGGGDAARVNTLVIENTGDLPILVLAGTVVKGGKQDRQIGQDFIIGKKQTVPVDAFCVEHGRWNATRNGAATGGKFQSLKTLAAGDVRAAGQYEQNQSQVWSKVGEINKATGKQTASDTLTASLESPDVQAERAKVGGQVHAFLHGVPMAERTVGLAYAIGGEVQGARFFIHHRLFAQYEEMLVNTVVVDSFTTRAVAKANGKAEAPGACAPEKVAEFVAAAGRGRKEQRATQGDNVNAYEFSDEVYASDAQLKGASPAAKPKSITKDFLKKK